MLRWGKKMFIKNIIDTPRRLNKYIKNDCEMNSVAYGLLTRAHLPLNALKTHLVAVPVRVTVFFVPPRLPPPVMTDGFVFRWLAAGPVSSLLPIVTVIFFFAGSLVLNASGAFVIRRLLFTVDGATVFEADLFCLAFVGAATFLRAATGPALLFDFDFLFSTDDNVLRRHCK